MPWKLALATRPSRPSQASLAGGSVDLGAVRPEPLPASCSSQGALGGHDCRPVLSAALTQMRCSVTRDRLRAAPSGSMIMGRLSRSLASQWLASALGLVGFGGERMGRVWQGRLKGYGLCWKLASISRALFAFPIRNKIAESRMCEQVSVLEAFQKLQSQTKPAASIANFILPSACAPRQSPCRFPTLWKQKRACIKADLILAIR